MRVLMLAFAILRASAAPITLTSYSDAYCGSKKGSFVVEDGTCYDMGKVPESPVTGDAYETITCRDNGDALVTLYSRTGGNCTKQLGLQYLWKAGSCRPVTGIPGVAPYSIMHKCSGVTLADNLATNGVVHIIDGLLLPPSSPSPSRTPPAKPITLTSYFGRDCHPPVKGIVELEDGKCYALSAVKTSAVNADQRITCLANGDADIISYGSQDGSCTGVGHNFKLFANQCMLGESVGGQQFAVKHKCPGMELVV